MTIYITGVEQDGIIVIGTKENKLNIFKIVSNKEEKTIEIVPYNENFDCGEKIHSLDIDDVGAIYVGTSSGAIKRYILDATGSISEENSYRLELKCHGAQIDGVLPQVYNCEEKVV